MGRAGRVSVLADDHRVAAAAREVLCRAGFKIDRMEETIVIGPLAIDGARHQVRVSGRRIALTALEYRVLVALARRAGWVITADQLLREAWGNEYQGDVGYLRPIISRLRRKLGDEPKRPRLIETVRGLGYRLGPGR